MADQTASQRRTEDLIAGRLARCWKCDVRRLAEYDRVDYYLVRDETVMAVCELKVRDVKHDAYPTVYLSARKYASLTLLGSAFGVRPLFIVAFADGWLGYVNVLDVPRQKLLMRGRHDRNKDNDVEPMLQVPLESFKLISEAH